MYRVVPPLAAAAAAVCLVPLPGVRDVFDWIPGLPLTREAIFAVLMAVFAVWGLLSRAAPAPEAAKKPDGG